MKYIRDAVLDPMLKTRKERLETEEKILKKKLEGEHTDMDTLLYNKVCGALEEIKSVQTFLKKNYIMGVKDVR